MDNLCEYISKIRGSSNFRGTSVSGPEFIGDKNGHLGLCNFLESFINK